MKRKRTSKKEDLEILSIVTEHLLKKNIKPEMTLREYAAFSGVDFKQVVIDANGGKLPLMEPKNPNKRELRRVNVAAIYTKALAKSLLEI